MAISTELQMAPPTVGVLIHGCHLKAGRWEQIVFGDGNRLGRVPVGVALAVAKKAQLIFWGSAGSVHECGQKESEYTYSQTVGPKFQELTQTLGMDPTSLLSFLNEVSHTDKETKNTTEEIRDAIKRCGELKIKELYLVSSATHIARCLQEACKLQAESGDTTLQIFATASPTCFADSTASDVVIIEPPHRPDMPNEPFHIILRRIFQFLRPGLGALARRVHEMMAAVITENEGLVEQYRQNGAAPV